MNIIKSNDLPVSIASQVPDDRHIYRPESSTSSLPRVPLRVVDPQKDLDLRSDGTLEVPGFRERESE